MRRGRSKPAPALIAALALVVGAASTTAACAPSSVSEAEEKRNVAWLVKNGSPEAVQALGHLADKDTAAENALARRATATNDVNVDIAAWAAVLRGASWGAVLLRDALADPARAETAASAMQRKDPHLASFASALEAALVKSGTASRSLAVAALLASAGPGAHDAVERRLRDKGTRGAMCRGVVVPEASDDAQQLLMKVDAASRDDVDCVDAVVRIAARDDTALAWLAAVGEPGLLTHAGKSEVIACPRMKQLWTEAVQARPSGQFGALAVPLSEAVTRCPSALDPLLASTLSGGTTAAQALVVAAIDPFGAATTELRVTCASFPLVLRSRTASARTRERAADVVAHGCRNAVAAAR